MDLLGHLRRQLLAHGHVTVNVERNDSSVASPPCRVRVGNADGGAHMVHDMGGQKSRKDLNRGGGGTQSGHEGGFQGPGNHHRFRRLFQLGVGKQAVSGKSRFLRELGIARVRNCTH